MAMLAVHVTNDHDPNLSFLDDYILYRYILLRHRSKPAELGHCFRCLTQADVTCVLEVWADRWRRMNPERRATFRMD